MTPASLSGAGTREDNLMAADLHSEQRSHSVLRREAVRVQAAPVSIGRGSHHCDVEISVQRDGEVIREIEIRCRCGERIVLDCTPA